MITIRQITTAFLATPLLLLSNQLLANSIEKIDASNLDMGIAYKTYSIALPSQVVASEDDDNNQFPALAFIVKDDLNEYFSISFEAAKGLSDGSSGYDFTVEDIDINERYTAQLDYSFSVTGKLRLLADTMLRPYLLLGGNAAAISYDYQQTVADEITDESSETLTSTGVHYGAGLELVTDHNLELSLSYENIAHFKYDIYALSLAATWSF
jgi:hypothetical protein